MVWSGAIIAIPSGWALCDGTNGTPDLRDRFIVGAGTTYDPADTGGVSAHDHDIMDGGHQHTIPAGTGLKTGGDYDLTTLSATMSAITGPGSNIPPYYALAFIMKL